MMFGLSQKVIEQIHGVLEQHPQVQEALIYGSRARGNYKPGSDIDLVLCGDQSLNHGCAPANQVGAGGTASALYL